MQSDKIHPASIMPYDVTIDPSRYVASIIHPASIRTHNIMTAGKSCSQANLHKKKYTYNKQKYINILKI